MNTSSPAVRRPRPAALRRVGVLVGVLGCSLVATSAAHAAPLTVVNFNIDVFPVDRRWDGVNADDRSPSTAAYSATYDVYDNPDGDNVQEVIQQLRGGVVIDQQDFVTPGVTPQTPVVSVQPGDVFRMTNRADGSVLAETTFTGGPTVTSSVLGQGGFAGTRSADSTFTNVQLLRRLDETHYSRNRFTGVYTWDGPVAKAAATDPDYDYSAVQEGDLSYPAQPAAPPAGQQYRLRLVTPARYETSTYRTNEFETVAPGRLTSLGDTSFTGAFAVPILAGDLVEVSQSTEVRSPTLRTSVNLKVATPAGAVPPPAPADRAAPKVTAFDIASGRTTVAQFLKTGLTSFVGLDEAGTVQQQLQVLVKPKKRAAKKPRKGSSGKGRRPSAKKQGGTASARAAARPKVVVIGVGKGAVPVPAAGGTAKSKVLATKDARKKLASLGTTVVSATLVTTVKDGAGNAATTTKPVRLAENRTAKRTTAKKKRTTTGKKKPVGRT